MTRIIRWIPALALAMAAATALPSARAATPARSSTTTAERRGLDLLPTRQALRLSRGNRTAATPHMASAAVAVDEVGDVDSFGRSLTWLGVSQAAFSLEPTCDPTAADPCQVIASPSANTAFSFPDAARITLPGRATHSLMCYWFSPYINVTYTNPGTTNVVAQLRYSPTLTVENSVLADPALIDPTTGAPFGGRLMTGMTASEVFQVPLPPSTTVSERYRDSAVCIAGFLNRRMLTDTFGLSAAQVDEFFRRPTTVRLNISGSVRGVGSAQLVFGLRIIGD